MPTFLFSPYHRRSGGCQPFSINKVPRKQNHPWWGGEFMETYQTVHLWFTSRFMSFCKAMHRLVRGSAHWRTLEPVWWRNRISRKSIARKKEVIKNLIILLSPAHHFLEERPSSLSKRELFSIYKT